MPRLETHPALKKFHGASVGYLLSRGLFNVVDSYGLCREVRSTGRGMAPLIIDVVRRLSDKECEFNRGCFSSGV